MSKTQFLASHYNDIFKENALPINAFIEIMVALVRKPMRPFMAQAVANIQKSVAMIVTDVRETDFSSVASAPNFKWRKLFHSI